MSEDVDVAFESEVADFYRSLGITQGPGDVQYRLIIKVLAKNGGHITMFSELREYTDAVADRGSIGSKMKTVFQLEGLAEKVQRGGYVITNKGITAAKFIDTTSKFYRTTKRMDEIIERIP